MKPSLTTTYIPKAASEESRDLKAVFVRWIDSVRHAQGWQLSSFYQNNARLNGVMQIESVGWLLTEDGDSITLCQSSAVNFDCVVEVFQIPKVAM